MARRSIDNLENAVKTHLSWLTDDQKAEVKKLINEGKSFEVLRKKVLEYYGALSIEAKDKTQLLQEDCQSLIKELVGEEKANELKKLRESGASKTELKNKIVALMDELTNPEKKEKAVKFVGGCQKDFEIESAREFAGEHRINHAKFEEALTTNLSWLTDDQKEQLRRLISEGKSFEYVQKKVFEFYGALSGVSKTKATELLQEGCRSVIKDLVGEEKANELKKLRESGASKTELKEKTFKLMDELTDPEKKEKAVNKLDHYFKTPLNWLTDDQKETLKTLKAEGKPFNDLQDKVFEFYAKLPDDDKKKAKDQRQEGCRGLIKEIAGEDKANELKKLRESGASKSEIEKKIAEFMDQLTDEDKKQTAVKYSPACKRIFDLDEPKRKKRDHHNEADKLQEALNTHLSWLTDQQKSTLKTLQFEGKSFKDLNDKVFEWYGQLSGKAQQKAKELMQGGCRAWIKELFGDEKAEVLKKLRESGAPKEAIEKKVASFLDTLTMKTRRKKLSNMLQHAKKFLILVKFKLIC
uniref:Polyprotein allergen nematode domain-containing protein n=1 Tax=Acrobeloides nanus TaxID=290746 RepID=A0A914DRR4_9BILA